MFELVWLIPLLYQNHRSGEQWILDNSGFFMHGMLTFELNSTLIYKKKRLLNYGILANQNY